MIHVCEPLLDNAEIFNVIDCIKNSHLTDGYYVRQFEERWAAYCGRKYGIAVSNGTVALQLAVEALATITDPKRNSIIIPAFTIASCVLAAIRNKFNPVFIDVDRDTWCLDADLLESVYDDTVSMIMPVHMYGHPADMNKIMGFKSDKIRVIEDAAQAHGARYKFGQTVKKAGGVGDISCFSFYSNKIITTGEGGMILTDNSDLDKYLRSARNLCFGIGFDRFDHIGIGHNFRMSDIQAAIGLAQIPKINTVIDSKHRIYSIYRVLLDHPSITHQSQANSVISSRWMHGIVLDRPAKPIMMKLAEKGVETRPFFSRLQGSRFDDFDFFKQLPVTNWLSTNGFYLPSGVQLTEEQQDLISKEIVRLL